MSVKRKQRRQQGNAADARREINNLSSKYPPSSDWEFRVAFANMGERTGFFEDVNNMNETGIESFLFPWTAEFVKRWPWGDAEQGLNPADEASYHQLSEKQWEEVQVRLFAAMARFRDADV